MEISQFSPLVCYFFFFVKTFLGQLWIYNKSERKVQRFLIYLLLPNCRVSPINRITHQNDIFYTKDELYWYIMITQSPWFTLGFLVVYILWVWAIYNYINPL